jgi:CxxC motif-containing protein (DUF1111 family)
MKNRFGFIAVVCLTAALVLVAAVPNLQAQDGNFPPGLGQDPGLGSLPLLPAGTVTCSSTNNPNHVLDAAASNPHGQPVGDIPTPLQNLSQNQLDLFCAAIGEFQVINSLDGVIPNAGATNCTPADLPAGSTGTILCVEVAPGLGPRFNGNSCAMCHFNPTFLGASGSLNPEATAVPELFVPTGGVGVLDGATNSLAAFANAPYQINATSPIREVRFIYQPNTSNTDGTVHDLFTVKGRVDATNAININPALGNTTCSEQQPDFTDAVNEGNVIFRIPIVAQGDGLVELIDDENLELNHTAFAGNTNGISGTFNHSGNTFNITRFGWKAQNPSMSVFAGEAYDVEQGVTNDLFPNERRYDDDLLGETLTQIQDCQFHSLPEDSVNFVAGSSNSNEGNLTSEISSAIFNFAAAMRLSAPPPQSALTTAEKTGKTLFAQIGCNQCHANNSTGDMVTVANSTFPVGQNIEPVLAFSDFAIHTMASGPGLTNQYGLACLDDSVMQGMAAGNMFRSAPLWGTTTRQFFLHDGRTTSLADAVLYHDCAGSEAHDVVNAFVALSTTDQDDILAYLRTL